VSQSVQWSPRFPNECDGLGRKSGPAARGTLRSMRAIAGLFALALAASCSLGSLDELKGDPSADAGATGGAAGSAGSGGAAGGVATGGSSGDAGPEGGLACGAGTKQCGSVCVSTSTVAFGCSATDCAACSLPHTISAACGASGACEVKDCDTGWGDCTAEPGCETPLNTVTSCGSCGMACGTNEVCATNSCVTSCPQTATNCNGACVSTMSDSQNCGSCGTQCPGALNGVGICSNGICAIQCNSGYVKCGTKCVDVANDKANCGSCGTVCVGGVHADPVCTAGTCALTCDPGFLDCSDNESGCETNGQTDVVNCGACGTVCPCNCAEGKCVSGPAC